MPQYVYTNEENGESVQRVYPMTRIPRTIRVKGLVYHRDIAAEHGGFKNTPGNWPQKSWSVGVHPSQIKEAYAESVRNGVPTDFAPNGDRIFRDRKHRADWCKANNTFDRSAGYGDACRK